MAGMRVVALSHVDEYRTAFIYGHGVYEGLFTWGDERPSPPRIPTEAERLDVFRSPRIKLDNGKYIWGMQCWWVDEVDYIRHPPMQEVIIDIDD